MELELEVYNAPIGAERLNIVQLEDLERYVKTMEESGEFKEQYEMLKRTACLKTCSVSNQPQNSPLNRYCDQLPYDDNRVILQQIKSKQSSTYINASYVKSYKKDFSYICAQGPMRSSVDDFWRMIWQEDSNVICMIGNLIEDGQVKCEKYWPEKATKISGIFVHPLKETTYLDYIMRDFKLTMNGERETRIVRQFQYKAWRDHSVPIYAMSLLNVLKEMKQFQETQRKWTPWIVHCSAGAGRSGTVMVLDSAIEMSNTEKKVDVVRILYEMRQQRMNVVANVEQYIFVHKALVAYHFGDYTCQPCDKMVLYFNKLRQTDPEKKKMKLNLQYENLRSLEDWRYGQKYQFSTHRNNKNKNRDPKIIPTEDGRVTHSRFRSTFDYINAVHVSSYADIDHFIVTQSPLTCTMGDFWEMVWEKKSTSIVVINEFENNNQICPIFWPQTGSVHHGHIKIKHLSSEPEYFGGVLIRKFQLKDEKDQKRKIKTFHLHGWRKEDSIPPQLETLVQLIAKVEKWNQQSKKTHPIIVTCYDGAKASGFYCAASYIAYQIYEMQTADVIEAVRTIRKNRNAFIPTVEQYRWLYEFACFLVSEKTLRYF